MKFVRFLLENSIQLGVYTNDETKILPINRVLQKTYTDFIDFIKNHTSAEFTALQQAIARPLEPDCIAAEKIVVLAPIEKPVHDIICVGVNYKAHLEETKRDFDTDSFLEKKKCVYFSKRAGFILGSGDTIQGKFHLDQNLDYEVELAVIIGKEGKNIPPEQAEDYIFGYSIFNDFTSRRIQKERLQWFLGKSMEGYSAMGPVILSKDQLPFPIAVDVRSKVNGDIRQNSNTRLLIHDIPSILAELSQVFTLEPGDIIATGTPAGVGMGFDPPKFLKQGDEVVCEIPPIGKLVNIIK